MNLVASRDPESCYLSLGELTHLVVFGAQAHLLPDQRPYAHTCLYTNFQEHPGTVSESPPYIQKDRKKIHFCILLCNRNQEINCAFMFVHSLEMIKI